MKERVEILEQQVQALTEARPQTGRHKDWRRTFAASARDAGFDEMIALGRAVRAADTVTMPRKSKPRPRADS